MLQLMKVLQISPISKLHRRSIFQNSKMSQTIMHNGHRSNYRQISDIVIVVITDRFRRCLYWNNDTAKPHLRWYYALKVFIFCTVNLRTRQCPTLMRILCRYRLLSTIKSSHFWYHTFIAFPLWSWFLMI